MVSASSLVLDGHIRSSHSLNDQPPLIPFEHFDFEAGMFMFLAFVLKCVKSIQEE